MRATGKIILALALLAGLVGWLAWPTKHSVTTSATDAGTSSIGTAPREVGAVERTMGTLDLALAGGPALLAISSASGRQLRPVTDALRLELPPGEYGLSASNDDGVADAAVTIRAGETTSLTLKIAPLVDAVIVSGTVKDLLGGTVAGADVWIGAPETLRGVVVARTNGDGAFSMRVTRGRHEIMARAAGYADLKDKILVVEAESLSLVLHPAATLRGVVVREDDRPVEGAHVEVLFEDHETTTDAEGKFVIEGLRAGRFMVQAKTATDVGIVRDVGLAPASSADVRIVVREGVFFAGHVRSADGAAIANAEVKAISGGDGVSEKSDASGAYRVGPVGPGIVHIEACAERHVCRDLQKFFERTPSAPVDFALSAGSTLRLDIVDENNAPVAGAHVFLGQPHGFCESDAEGHCVLDELVPRSDVLHIDHPKAGHLDDERLTILPGENRRTVRLTNGATVRGTVHWDDGKPAAGIEVSSGYGDAATHAGPDGRYELTNVGTPFARIVARPSKPVGAGMYAGDSALMPDGSADQNVRNLAPRAVRDGIDLVVKRTSKSISGRVVDASGAPVAAARVGIIVDDERVESNLQRMWDTARSYASADGAFTLDDVPNGRFVVWAEAEGAGRGLVRAVAAGATNVEVKLPAGATLEGEVTDERGAPMRRFSATLDLRTSIPSGTDGHFTLKGLTAGTYKITVQGAAADGETAVVASTVTLVDGQVTKASYVLAHSVVVTGRIVGADHAPVSDITLRFFGSFFAHAEPTSADGRFRITGIPAGVPAGFSADDRANHRYGGWKKDIPSGVTTFDVGDLVFDQAYR